MFERACNQSRSNLDVTKSDTQLSALSLDEFCNFLFDATGSSRAASGLLFRRADYDSKNAVTWDDVLPHILKKHATQQASKRDIPYSINLLRADPEICHQKVLLLLFNALLNVTLNTGSSCLHDSMSAAARHMHSWYGLPSCNVLAAANIETNVKFTNGSTASQVCTRISARCCVGFNLQIARFRRS